MISTGTEAKPILWNANFIQCCISYFFMSFAFYMLMPIIPLYLTEELIIEPSKVGLVISSYTVGLLCVRPFSGYLVDNFTRKHLYLFAFCLYTLLFFGYYFANTVTTIMLVRFIQGGCMGLTSVAGNTIIIDVIPSQRRGEGMGFYGVTLNLSMSLAPIVAIWIYETYYFTSLISGCLITACIGFSSVFLLHYTKPKTVKQVKLSLDRFILLKALPSALSYILSAIPYGMIVSFVVLYGKEINISHPGYFFIFMALGVAVSRIISGKLIDTGKVHSVCICSLICLTASFLLFSVVHEQIIFFICAGLIGIGFGISIPAYQYVFVNVASPERRGAATSTYLTSFDIGVGSGTLIAGFIASYFTLSVAFLVGSCFCLFSLLVYLFLSKPYYERYKLTT
ncbi:MAG: MFS transporter [Tannerellaceae bacterium]|nr:MFS transporter [Tannerellaceae bacterium]